MKIIVNAMFLTQEITGVQRYSIEISKELKKLFPEHELKFVAPKNILQKEVADLLKIKIIGNLTGFLWEQVELPLYAFKHRDSIVLNLRNTAPLLSKKNVIVIHDLIFMKNPKWFSKLLPSFYRFFAPILLKNALKIITVSEFSRTDIAKSFNINKNCIEIVPNAVSEEFKGCAESDCACDFNNHYGKYVLTTAALLSPRKNLPKIIEAFEKLGIPELKLVIVGNYVKNFSDEESLKAVKANKNIILTGRITDKELSNLYRHAAVFVFPSLYEGFGLPVIEAMACGCPVIASNLSSLPEVCADAAYFVNPNDSDEIAYGIKKIIENNDLRNFYIQKGFKRHKDFSWRASALKLKSIIY